MFLAMRWNDCGPVKCVCQHGARGQPCFGFGTESDIKCSFGVVLVGCTLVSFGFGRNYTVISVPNNRESDLMMALVTSRDNLSELSVFWFVF